MDAKQIVDRIYEEKAKNDSNSKDLARTLNVLSKTVFGDINRFVFELLQNADDSSLDHDQDINVEFKLLDNYLIFSHNGAHFTKEDVIGISGIGNKASEKDKNIEKTGYKGIGFKSVFGSSDYAHIISGGFSFRFDKNYNGYSRSEDYPWQVIPIWTDVPVDEVVDEYNSNRVNTIIGIKNRKAIRSEVVKVFKDCQILLFLRRVNSITFLDQNDIVFQISKRVLTNDVIELYNDSKLVSSWIIRTFDLPINDDLSEQLNQLSEAECPQKLKEATSTKITFAASVENSIIFPVKAAVIYSYLPTKLAMGFSFLVNGDFLTNAERTDLLSNIWNEFLFSEIAVKQLDWFVELQLSNFRYEVLKLLKGKYPLYSISNIEKSYNTSLELAAKTIAFLPEQDSQRLIPIVNCIIDSTEFCELFSPELITNFLKVNQNHGVIDLRVESQNTLTGLGAKQFVFNQVIELIATGIISRPPEATNIVVFFYNKTINDKNSSWLTALADAPFILDEKGGFKTPKEIFFPLADNRESEDIDFENLSFIHGEILAHFSTAPAVMAWLQNLGVKEPTDLEIVKKAIIPLIRNNKVTEHNALKITRFIFRVFVSRLLSDSDYDNLRSLSLLSINGLRLPAQCYLSDKFNPEKKLSAIIPNANFTVDTYPEVEGDIPEWKTFFKKIGVRENITIEIIEEKVERRTFGGLHNEAEPYFMWLENNTYFPEIYHSWRFSGQHYIQNFTAMDFRLHLEKIEFSKFFWGKMLANWDQFIEKCTNTIYYYRNGHEKVPSFVQYYVMNFNSIPCTDGRCCRSTAVFSPALKSVVGNFFPVADLSTAITAEQADFFGFKRHISIGDCLELLDKIAEQHPTSELRKQIFSIYDQLISQSSETASTVKSLISKWRKNAKLLSVNNTFQPVEKLYCFSVLGTSAPINSERFAKFPLSRSFDEIKSLCDLLGIPVITFELLKFVSEGVIVETILPKAILSKARFLALIQAHNSNDNFPQVLSRLRRIIGEIQFLQAEKLNLIYQLEDGEVIFNSKIDSWDDKGANFYFSGKWNSAITLYGLSSTICALLGYKDMEREFGLVLQSSEEDIYEWLEEKGYKIEELIADESPEQFFPDYDNDETPTETDELDGIDIQIEESFIPKVNIIDIDFQGVQPETKVFSEPLVGYHQEYKRLTNKKAAVDIGRWSENFIYNYLQENPDAFSNIKWLNKDTESYLPYDFEVVEKGVPRLIEVKGTPSLIKEVVELSPAEWKVLFDQGPAYTMFRVFGVGTTDYRFERTDNLRELIEGGKIMPSPILLLI